MILLILAGLSTHSKRPSESSYEKGGPCVIFLGFVLLPVGRSVGVVFTIERPNLTFCGKRQQCFGSLLAFQCKSRCFFFALVHEPKASQPPARPLFVSHVNDQRAASRVIASYFYCPAGDSHEDDCSNFERAARPELSGALSSSISAFFALHGRCVGTAIA